ncbi:MAG TPA: asparagine synthase (glutamine-hydrolyzing) [Thermoanaerobaculia bacterium]
MCGICGTAGFVNAELLRRMTDLIAHRGPDDDGTYAAPDGSVGLGNRRLSIIDLSAAGHMPMSNDDGTLWITYNGEIYNFAVLREELESLGHRFRSHTDTEVVLRGFDEWGAGVFAKLNGMFALAVWNAKERTLTLARDRWGQKPLYYAAQQRKLWFASEAKCLLLDPAIARNVRLDRLPAFLNHLSVPAPDTIFEGIYKLEPAHYLVWRDGAIQKKRYWTPSDAQTAIGDDEAAEQFRTLFRRAVARHLVSDVPLGVFLSGGVDSSSILAAAAEVTPEPVRSYTIGYRPDDAAMEQSGASDVHHARLVAKQFGARYREFILEPDLAQLLPKLVWNLDEPIADAAVISSYLICREARDEVKVLLSGQAADEFLAGYNLHQAYAAARLLRRVPNVLRNRILQPLARGASLAKRGVPGMGAGTLRAAGRFLDKTLDAVDLSAEEMYLRFRAFGATGEQIPALLSPEVRRQVGANDPSAFEHAMFAGLPRGMDPLTRITRVDAATFLPEVNLAYTDKTSSAASVEVRVPFLDNDLVDFMLSLPPDLKLRGRTGKYVLKRAMTGILPNEVLYRRKAPFASPMRTWLRRELREMLLDELSPDVIRRQGIFDADEVTAYVNAHLAGTADAMYILLSLLTFQLWHRTYISAPVQEASVA